MYKGMYIPLSSASGASQIRMDLIAHNLANVNTVGYKKERINFTDAFIGEIGGAEGGENGRIMAKVATVSTDFSEGNMIRTGNPLDTAIEGSGFFGLEGGRYTRRGDMKIDGDGYLVTQHGIKVLGQNGGPISMPEGTVEISDRGEIFVDGVSVDTLMVTDFSDPSALSKIGGDLFRGEGGVPASTSSVKQGYVESSNVDVVMEMVRMIDALRLFETYSKAMQTFDDAASKVVGDMARLS